MNTRRCDFFSDYSVIADSGHFLGIDSYYFILGRFGEKRINRCIYYSPLQGNFDDDVPFQNWHMYYMSKIMVHYVVSVSICKLLTYPDTQCIVYLPTKLGSLGGKCRYIHQPH